MNEPDFSIPTRDGLSVTIENDGGISIHISMKKATLDALRREKAGELQTLALAFMALQSRLEPETPGPQRPHKN